ncbi:ABC transporter ATP-binding protein [Patescibacteria group bacterium]|nr:ABC transporter ATP-binding protein [Patescibacteria group bacterium]
MKQKQETLVQLHNISISFGGVHALSHVSVDLDEGEIIVLMGPNGAGKSTVLKSMFGIYHRDSGSILWHNQPIEPVAHEMVKRGISYVPQGRQIFKSLSVKENLEMGGITIPSRKLLNERMNDVLELFPDLREKINQSSGSLSGGQQQMLAIARGLITDPKVLLLDEPSLGLSPKLVKQVFAKVKEINDKRGTAIVIVEHNIKSILEIVDRAYLLDKGKLITVDTPKNIMNSTLLQDVFMARV